MWAPVGVPATPLPTKVPANVSGGTEEDGPSTCLLPHMWETQKKLPVPDLSQCSAG